MAIGSRRSTGVLTRWNDRRGFGYISPHTGGKDVFVHISAFPREWDRPVVGEALGYEVGSGDNGRPRAQSITLPGPAATRRPATRTPGPRTPGARAAGGGAYLAIVFLVALYLVLDSHRSIPGWFAVIYVAASVAAFALYATDKAAARAGRWRTPEASLLFVGLVGGWPGAIVAQQVFRHKTRKVSFQRLFWMTVVANLVLFVALASPLVANLSA